MSQRNLKPAILLVDDDPVKRYTIAKTLIRAGFEVSEAESGSEALRLVASLPDLVILDVKLPDIDGFEVCRRIKSDPATSAIPVLHISTTFVDIEDKVHGLDSGADGYLTNVAEPMELIATVRALLRARRAEDAAQLSKRQWQTTFDAISDGVMLARLRRQGHAGQPDRRASSWGSPGPRSWASTFTNCGMSHPSPVTRYSRECSSPASAKPGTSPWAIAGFMSRSIRCATAATRSMGALCLVSDITNRKRMEMQLLRQAEKLHEDSQRKDEFLAMLAHELRNPARPPRKCPADHRLADAGKSADRRIARHCRPPDPPYGPTTGRPL